MKNAGKLKVSLLTLAMLLSFVLANASNDSTNAAINSGAEGVLSIIFSFLTKSFPILTPFTGIIILLIMALIRKFEKQNVKNKSAEQIKGIIESPNAGGLTSAHVSFFRSIIDKLEGKNK